MWPICSVQGLGDIGAMDDLEELISMRYVVFGSSLNHRILV